MGYLSMKIQAALRCRSGLVMAAENRARVSAGRKNRGRGRTPGLAVGVGVLSTTPHARIDPDTEADKIQNRIPSSVEGPPNDRQGGCLTFAVLSAPDRESK